MEYIWYIIAALGAGIGTGLMASVSHMIIHPAIILKRWDVMLICIVIATAASLISAQFANRYMERLCSMQR